MANSDRIKAEITIKSYVILLNSAKHNLIALLAFYLIKMSISEQQASTGICHQQLE